MRSGGLPRPPASAFQRASQPTLSKPPIAGLIEPGPALLIHLPADASNRIVRPILLFNCILHDRTEQPSTLRIDEGRIERHIVPLLGRRPIKGISSPISGPFSGT
jgi:hypothetical protein